MLWAGSLEEKSLLLKSHQSLSFSHPHPLPLSLALSAGLKSNRYSRTYLDANDAPSIYFYLFFCQLSSLCSCCWVLSLERKTPSVIYVFVCVYGVCVCVSYLHTLTRLPVSHSHFVAHHRETAAERSVCLITQLCGKTRTTRLQ